MTDNKLEKLRNREKIFLIIGCVFMGQAGANFDFGQYVTAIVFFAIWVACTVGVFITSSKIAHREFELERKNVKAKDFLKAWSNICKNCRHICHGCRLNQMCGSYNAFETYFRIDNFDEEDFEYLIKLVMEKQK